MNRWGLGNSVRTGWETKTRARQGRLTQGGSGEPGSVGLLTLRCTPRLISALPCCSAPASGAGLLTASVGPHLLASGWRGLGEALRQVEGQGTSHCWAMSWAGAVPL